VSKAEADAARKNQTLLLYQYEVCPWCNKVKAVLDYYKVPYQVVEVDPLRKSQIKFSEYKKVPIVVTPSGDQVNDSNEIIRYVTQDLVTTSSSGGW
jgi:microsomal prostaglandin-E synthase 2